MLWDGDFMYKWACCDCKYLDKTKIEYAEDKYCFRYGCNKEKYIVGWIIDKNKDRQLKEMGCSEFEEKLEVEQMSFF
jgi:hypothetical protein